MPENDEVVDMDEVLKNADDIIEDEAEKEPDSELGDDDTIDEVDDDTIDDE